MIRIATLALVLSLVASSLHAQLFPDRYRTEVFPNVTITSNVLFSTGVPQPEPGGGFYEFVTGYPLNADESDTSPRNLYMDIYEPTGDTLAERPLILIAFGGGFLSGSRSHWSMVELATQLARRGFVTACIDYRLGMNIFDEDLSKRAVYRAVQDGRSAVRFFRADAATSNQYRIDPEKVFIGGHSSGAFVALHNLYMDKDVERPASTRLWYHDGDWLPDLGPLDEVGNNVGYDGHANAAFNLAGALGFTSFIEGGEIEDVVMFHSTDDGTVPYYSGEPFSNISYLVIGSDLPIVYGSDSIRARAEQTGLNYQFYSYADRGHGVHEDGDSDLYSDIVPGIADFLHTYHLKPQAIEWAADTVACDTQQIYDYSVMESDGKYWDWQMAGGEFSMRDSSMNSVSVHWQLPAGSHQISVTPYSKHKARGDAYTQSIFVTETTTNAYMPTVSGAWTVGSNWSLGMVPMACQHVHVPAQNTPVIIDASDPLIGLQKRILSLGLGNGVELHLNNGNRLHITDQD